MRDEKIIYDISFSYWLSVQPKTSYFGNISWKIENWAIKKNGFTARSPSEYSLPLRTEKGGI